MFRIGLPFAPPTHSQSDKCPHCHGHLRRVESFTNIHSDKPVRIYKCADCQRLTFDD